MRITFRIALGVVLVSVALGGCANLQSIYRNKSLSAPDTITLVDAKQRGILSSKHKETRYEYPPSPVPGADQKSDAVDQRPSVAIVETYRRFCTEPSPDVFTVLSQALSASGTGTRTAEALEVALKFAYSSSEAGSTIARTQTINMLREMMYRTCERYLSGAIGPTEFTIQAIRDQRTMVSILAIEQLTGTVFPRSVALQGDAGAASGSASSEALVRLDEAYKALTTANTTLEKAQAVLSELDKTGTKCAELTKEDAKPADADKDKQAKCVKTQADVNAATAAQKAAKAHYEELSKLAGQIDNQPSAKASTSAAFQSEGEHHAAIVKEVAQAVQTIVLSTFDQDEFLLFCIRQFENGRARYQDPELREACITYITKAGERSQENSDAKSDVLRQYFKSSSEQWMR